MPPANVVDVNPSTENQTPEPVNIPSSDIPHESPEKIFANLILQEDLHIDALKGIRGLKKTILKTHSPKPKKNSPYQVRKQILRETTKDFLKILRSINVQATPHHVINELAVRCDGVSGDGSRQIFYNMYFENHGSTEPKMVEDIKDIPEDAVLFAAESIGYTTIILEFMVNNEPMKIVGKSICSSGDNYNGNAGVLIALRDAFDQIEARKIDHPLLNLTKLIENFQKMNTISIFGPFYYND